MFDLLLARRQAFRPAESRALPTRRTTTPQIDSSGISSFFVVYSAIFWAFIAAAARTAGERFKRFISEEAA
jgi:hypothetical protein